MQIRARVVNRLMMHEASVETAGRARTLAIAPKEGVPGSSVSGGELLFLALATCYCNDVHREARKRNLRVDEITVEVSGEFDADGEPARNVKYEARVHSPEPIEAIEALLRHTDTVAEIQNSLRAAVPVELTGVEVTSERGRSGFAGLQFSEAARAAFTAAADRARTFGHRYVGTEHLLLGLLATAPQLFRKVGADRLESTLLGMISRGTPIVQGELPYTPAATNTIRFAMANGRASAPSVLEPEHLLAAVIDTASGVEGVVLHQTGIRSVDDLRVDGGE